MAHGEAAESSRKIELWMDETLLAAIDQASEVWRQRYAPDSKRAVRADFIRRACLAYVDEMDPEIAAGVTRLITPPRQKGWRRAA